MLGEFVTEWGFPALRWQDRVVTMVGNPQDPQPKIRVREIPRALWVDRSGVSLCWLDTDGRTVTLGPWHLFERLRIGSTRTDLTPDETRLLGLNRLAWIEHQTLEASFAGMSPQRIAVSAVPQAVMQRLHDAVAMKMAGIRHNYMPPDDGTCWRNQFLPENPITRDASHREAGPVTPLELSQIAFKDLRPRAAVRWFEPCASRPRWRWQATRHHVMAREIFAARGFWGEAWRIVFRTYPLAYAPIEINADLGFLQRLRVVHSDQLSVRTPFPFARPLGGWSVVADFRYGLSLPLTCVPATSRDGVVALAELLEDVFLPLVGTRLSPEQLGEG